MLSITLAQLNFTVGDITGNVQRMVQAAERAVAERAQMVVFSELSLCGYYPGDLLEEPAFIERITEGIAALQTASAAMPGLYWVVGAPTPSATPGKRLHNSLLVIEGGRIRLQYAKQLLPTYNIFDENRHFEAGPDVAKVLRIGHYQVGFLICEDGWNDHGADYATNPFNRMADAAPDVVISINASPSHIGKHEQRLAMVAQAAQRHQLPLLYVNQIGGHDQLVYDGASFAVEPATGVVYEAPRFTEAVQTLQLHNGHFALADGSAPPPVSHQGLPTMEFYRQQLVLGLRDYARRCGFHQAVVGSSGGIDSAVTLALAVQALGADNVTAVTMPSHYSSAGSVDDSVALCRNLGIALYTHPIGALVDSYAQQYASSFGNPLVGLPLENVQARIRGTVLMEYSNDRGHLLLTTGNKSEISVGYCTLYGDTNGGLGLLGDLYKTEVFELAKHLNHMHASAFIPQAIIDKPPSAELAPDQQDTDSLPPYPVLDQILKIKIEGLRLSPPEYASTMAIVAPLQATPEGAALVQRIHNMVDRNEYKRRQSPPILRVRARAFGSGRQMPIAAVYAA